MRLYNVYGPGADNADMKSVETLLSAIRRAINSPAGIFNIFDNVTQYRDFVYVDDVVEALVASTQKNSYMDAIQVGTGVTTTMQEAASLIAKLTSKCLGKQLNPTTFNSTKVHGGRVAMIRKAQRILSWSLKVSFTHGISMNYAWILRDMALRSNNDATLLQYALCIDEESEAKKMLGWSPPIRQAKRYKAVLPRPPGDTSAVLSHFFCEDERQSILEEIENHPPPRKTLLFKKSITQGGHVTFDSLLGNVLIYLDVDLALAVESQEYATHDAFRNKARYVWELNPPEGSNSGHLFNEIPPQCFNHTFDRSYAHVFCHLNKLDTSGWLGCIDGTAQNACAGLIIFYRWFALQNILKHKLYEKYDTVIVYFSRCLVASHNNASFPAEVGTMFVSNGTDWGGLMDWHYHMSMYDAVSNLGMVDLIMEGERAEDQKAYLLKYGFDKVENMEGAHRIWHVVIRQLLVQRYNATSLLVADALHCNAAEYRH